jgi:ABC-type cobalamin/Fe3+-siderophores transport system ATPase subunit
MKSILEVKNLSFGYEKNSKVLDGVNLCIEEGSITAILGKNGCGKSTLLDCIIGYNEYNEGQVIIDKEDIKGLLDWFCVQVDMLHREYTERNKKK